MGAQRTIDVQFPIGGLNRATSFQKQPPYTTISALNVRPQSVPERRARGGRRPGISKAFAEQLGSGNKINLINTVRPLNQAASSWFDTFPGPALSSYWTTMSGLTSLATTDLLIDTSGVRSSAAYGVSNISTGGSVRAAPNDIDTSGAWTFRGTCYEGASAGANTGARARHEIFTRMSNASPAPSTDSLSLRMDSWDSGTSINIAWSVRETVSGSATTAASGTVILAVGQARWQFKIFRSGTSNVFEINGAVVHSGTFTNSNSRQRVGLQSKAGVNSLSALVYAAYDAVAFDYTTTGSEGRADRLLAASNGTAYVESATGVLGAVSTALTLRADEPLRSQQRSSMLYIADYSGFPLAAATDGTTNGSPGTTFDSASYTDWTTLGIDTDDHVLVISAGSGATLGTYAISSVASGSLTLATSPGNSLSGLTFSIERSPKVYDSDAATLSAWSATSGKGTVPVGCPLVAMYRDRMVLAGARGAPHVWYMSRIGNANDWLYSDLDTGGAVAGTSTSAGIIAQPLTALIPFGDDYMLFACLNELWVLRGDPRISGQIGNISRKIGIIQKSAWCWGPSGELIFLSRDGLYVLAPGASSLPEPLSRGPLPDEFKDISPSNVAVVMEYDIEFQGVQIYLTPIDDTTATSWWFDYTTKSFWMQQVDPDHHPFSICNHDLLGASQRKTLIGCRDGYVRTFDDTSADDDGVAVDNHVYFGPFMLGDGQQYEGLITDLRCELDGKGGTVEWELFTGQTVSEAFNSTAVATGTFSTGLNYRPGRVRSRGFAAFLKLSGDDSSSFWAFERAWMKLKIAGKVRMVQKWA